MTAKRILILSDEECDRLIEWYEQLIAFDSDYEEDEEIAEKIKEARLKA